MIAPYDTTVQTTGFSARVMTPDRHETLSYRYFVPIERIINDPWFWYYLARYLRLDYNKGAHFLLWTRFIEKRCMNYSNIEALSDVTSHYGKPEKSIQ